MIQHWILGFLLLAGIASPAQMISLVDDCNPMIKSLSEVVYVVRSDYALQDEEENLFGKNGKDYFGSGYGPAILLDGELIFSEHTYKPFLTDTSYKSYGAKYIPVATDLYFKKITNKSMTKTEKKVQEEKGHVKAEFGDSASMNNGSVALKDSMPCVVITFIKTGKGKPDESTYRLSYLHNGVEWDGTLGKLGNSSLGGDASFGLIFYEDIGHGQVRYVFGGFVEQVNGEWTAMKYEKLKPLNKTNNKRGRKN